jgi:maltose/moltooligosaccharide transporter
MNAPSPPPATPRLPAAYTVGTLTYTRRELVLVMFWMLWGDFFFQLMESLPALVPLQLRWEGATDSTIGWINGLPPLLGFFMFPIAGVQSDRHRGKLGRRRPFLLWCTGPVVLGLVLLGAAKPIGALVYDLLSARAGLAVTMAGCTITWIALCVAVFVVFNAYVVQVYSCLVVDVIPQRVLGTYYGLYRAVGALGNLAFNRWVFGWAESHTFHVYLLVALLYAAAFYLIVWQVREGEYPPPPPRAASAFDWRVIPAYFRECFSTRLHFCYYFLTFFFWGSGVPLSFLVFFATNAGQPGYAPTLGLPLEQFGAVKGWTYLVSIPVYFLAGPVIDRFHALRLTLIGVLLTSASYFCGFWLVQDGVSLQIWWCVNQGFMAIYLVAVCVVAPLVLPREKFGQFVSANVAFGYVSLMILHPLVGWIMEQVRDYRYVFILCGVLTALAALACSVLILEWRRTQRTQAPTA